MGSPDRVRAKGVAERVRNQVERRDYHGDGEALADWKRKAIGVRAVPDRKDDCVQGLCAVAAERERNEPWQRIFR